MKMQKQEKTKNMYSVIEYYNCACMFGIVFHCAATLKRQYCISEWWILLISLSYKLAILSVCEMLLSAVVALAMFIFLLQVHAWVGK